MTALQTWTDNAIAKLRAELASKRDGNRRVGKLGAQLVAELADMPGKDKEKREARERIGAFMRACV